VLRQLVLRARPAARRHAFAGRALNRLTVDLLGFFATAPGGGFNRLVGLQGLVDLEEVLDLQDGVLAKILQVDDLVLARVAGRHTNDLVVATCLVAHVEDADRAGRNEAAWPSRLVEQHECVQGVVILAQGLLDVAVVSRVTSRGEEHPIKANATGCVVDFVFVAAAHRDFDGHVKVHQGRMPHLAYRQATLTWAKNQDRDRGGEVSMATASGVRQWWVAAATVSFVVLSGPAAVPVVMTAGSITAQDLSPVIAQNAVRPQLPSAVDFVLEPTQRGEAPDAEAVAEVARDGWDASSLGSSSRRGLTIRDALTGEHLVDLRADKDFTPASITKVLSAAAIMSVLTPEQIFATTVVTGDKPTDIVLVAGGDQLLAPGRGDPTAVVGRAGLGDLAKQTAAALEAAGVSEPVRLLLDTSYAQGSDVAPGWTDFWLTNGYTGRISMLALESARALPGSPAPANPTRQAAKTFQQALADEGISLSTTKITAASEPSAEQEDQTPLGRVESAPLRDVLALALATSDNAMVEQLSRQGAVAAGVSPKQKAVNEWVVATMTDYYKLDIDGAALADTSGLSDGTRLPMRLVADVLAAGASGAYPSLQSVLDGLPVAGYNGTMRDRFGADAANPGLGVVRAKTGSLPSVTSLAGTLTTRDGRLLVFALTTNDVEDGPGPVEARAAIDVLVSSLADCGC